MEQDKRHPIGDLTQTMIEKIREMVDVNTIMGEPVQAQGVTVVPVSTVSIGFASGGSDFTTKSQKPDGDNSFGGGSGAGIKMTPVGFLVITEDTVKFLPVEAPSGGALERIVDIAPELLKKATDFIEKQKEKKESKNTTQM
ncbi:MAG: GerW family sporulation protein [Oscillospiraceae bacterium]|nr:GerW family sporulation protein [Oscillospiraceae bacterium]